MKAIHLIQKDKTLRPEPIAPRSNEYRSGFWDLTTERAAELTGKSIYFYEAQNGQAFFGGIIRGFNQKTDEPWRGRIIFTLAASRSMKGHHTGPDGWSNEMKFEE